MLGSAICLSATRGSDVVMTPLSDDALLDELGGDEDEDEALLGDLWQLGGGVWTPTL